MSRTNDHPSQPKCGGTPNAPATIDPDRVAALYAEHSEELRRFVLGVLRDPDLVADVLQVTFSRALERGHTAREGTIKGWLFQVAFREALTVRRRREASNQAHQRLASLGFHSGEPPEEGMIRKELVEEVRKAVEALPAEQSRVVRARLSEDKTFAEIAEELDLPLGTVLTRMRLALEKLRRTLRSGE